MDWATLFDRRPAGVTEATVAHTLAEHRAERDGTNGDDATVGSAPRERGPARVVADADVLAADLLVGGDARRALELLWTHSWTTLCASDVLVADAESVIGTLADGDLAADWRTVFDRWREPVAHPAGDHPALASAYRGGAMHVLSLDDGLTGSAAGAALAGRFPVSVRPPSAFAAVFDPASLHGSVEADDYPGPDRPPRHPATDT